jgi:putative nucleotidyltransferase with HDIG domain
MTGPKQTISPIHRRLILHLVMVTLVVSVTLAGGVLFVRWNQLGAVVQDRARSSAARFVGAVGHLLEQPGAGEREDIRLTIERLATEARTQALGRFALIRLYDSNLSLLAEYTEVDSPEISAARAILSRAEPSQDHLAVPSSKVVVAGGKPRLWLTIPVREESGRVLAYGEGIFVPSDDTVWALRRGAILAAVAVCGIVALTALVLYPVILRLLGRVSALSFELLESHLETLKVLGSAIAKRDSDTDAHNFRVTLLSVRIAEAMGLQPDAMRALIKGAFLHDVGKIGMPDRILLKAGLLDEEEFTLMKTHVTHGVEIVGRSRWLQDALQVVEHHHEKVDGSGYPRGLAGDRFPVVARIFAIADVFDALTSRRPYKEPFSLEETLRILEQGRGTHFDSAVLDAFEGFARNAYEQIAGREDDGLKTEVSAVVQRYFAEDPGALQA